MAISPRVKSQLFERSKRLIRIGRHLPVAERKLPLSGSAWTEEEHNRFLQALELFPSGPWKAVAAYVGTKTPRQTMTHCQKYRQKIARHKRGLKITIVDKSGHLVAGPTAKPHVADELEIESCNGQICESLEFYLDLLANYEPLVLEDDMSLTERVDCIDF